MEPQICKELSVESVWSRTMWRPIVEHVIINIKKGQAFIMGTSTSMVWEDMDILTGMGTLTDTDTDMDTDMLMDMHMDILTLTIKGMDKLPTVILTSKKSR